MSRASRTIVAATALLSILAVAPPAAAASERAKATQANASGVAVAFVRAGIELTTADGETVAMSLPAERGSNSGRPTANRAKYESADYDLTVTRNAAGATTIIEIANADAPTTYHFDFDLPRGWRLEARPDGSVLIVDRIGELAGRIEAPWARDATGKELATSFEISGDANLVQTVAHAGAVYPVLADPRVTFGRNVYFWLRGYEASWWGAASASFLAAYICAAFAALHPVLCAISTLGALALSSAFREVLAGNQCRYVVAFRYWGWPNYVERLRGYGCSYLKYEIPG